MAGKVFFHYADRKLNLDHKKVIKSCIIQLFEQEKKQLDRINYIFCSDGYLIKMNKEFLNHDYYTDILTFDLSENGKIIGEVYISIDRVRDNAKEAGATFEEEAVRVVCHGALHLCGYKDKTKPEALIMREKENYYMSLYTSFVSRETKE